MTRDTSLVLRTTSQLKYPWSISHSGIAGPVPDFLVGFCHIDFILVMVVFVGWVWVQLSGTFGHFPGGRFLVRISISRAVEMTLLGPST